MNKLAFVQLGALALVLGAACEPDVTLEEALQNAKCRSTEPACVEGYHCDRDRDVCVRDNAGGGSGGTSSQSGAGGMPPVAANGGNGGVSVGGASGSGGMPQGGTGGTIIDVPDAAMPQDAGGDGCVPGPLYIDIDGDSYGSGAQLDFGCPHDNLVQNDDDCVDVDVFGSSFEGENIHPGQTEYFNVGYPAVGKPDDRSFDYDCSGAEEADETNTPPGRVPNCGEFGIGLNQCVGTGFVPDDRRPDGNGINSLCGSENVASCEVTGGILCVEGPSEGTQFVYRCK